MIDLAQREREILGSEGREKCEVLEGVMSNESENVL